MQHIWSILSKKSIIDSVSNNISIMEVIDEFKIDITIPKNLSETKKVAIPVELEITSLWYRDTPAGEYPFDFRIQLYDPSGNIANNFEGKLFFQKDKKRLRSQSKIQGFPVNESGVYKFVVGFKDKDMQQYKNVAGLPIDVILNKKLGEEIQIINLNKTIERK